MTTANSDPANDTLPPTETTATNTSRPRSVFALPVPIRRLFDKFPLSTYSENVLPQRATRLRGTNSFYMFVFKDMTLSPNPACLKWQIFLVTQGITIQTVPSNNHASPSGALPFLLQSPKKKDIQSQAIVSSKMQRWVENQCANNEMPPSQLDVYTSLIDTNLRSAWLFSFYLQPQNFDSLARAIYITPTSSNRFVRMALAHQLRTAATDELLKSKAYIDGQELYDAADAAFSALSNKLGDNQFFSESTTPNLFDASLFSYTHLILAFSIEERTEEPIWVESSLPDILNKHQNLVDHRSRVLECYNSRSL